MFWTRHYLHPDAGTVLTKPHLLLHHFIVLSKNELYFPSFYNFLLHTTLGIDSKSFLVFKGLSK